MIVDLKSWNAIAPRLLAFVRKRVSERAFAQDVVQDVFLLFHQRRHQVKDKDKLVSWIFRVAQNRIIDFYRDRKRSEVAIAIPSPEEDNRFTVCVANCLKEEIQALPEKYRLPFEKAELQAVPQIRLASEMGLSYSGLKSRVQRARELLRLRMKDKYYIEHDRFGNILACESILDASCPKG